MTTDSASGLFVQSSGPADAPSIVFLHGGGAAGWMWRSVIERLPEYHCLAPDLPEQGRSGAVQPFTMALAARCVADLIRAQAHGGKANVVGLSEGAQVTVELLANAPEVLTSAFVSSALLRPIPGAWMFSPGLLAATYYVFVAPFSNWDAWIRLNMHYSAGIPDEYFPDFKREFQTLSRDGWVNLMRANQTFRLHGTLSRVTCPVLVTAGAKEYPAMLQSARDLLQALPIARGALIDLGKQSTLAQEHNWAMNAPDAFASAVRAWLTGSPLPDSLKPFTA
jgi:pimeloyl-ACP methyl ester carboxylesterase